MRTTQQLEQIIHGVNPEAANSAYESLEQMESGELTLDQTYQQILEMVVYDILKTKKK